MFHKFDVGFIALKVSLLFYFGGFEMGYDFTGSSTSGSDQQQPASDKLRDGGTYIMIAESLEAKQTKKGDGTFIAAKFKVCDGACDGKTIWGNFNIVNHSPVAERIGKEAMASLTRAVGYDPANVEDLKLLCFIPFLATLKTRRDAQDEIRFEVAKFTPLEEPERVRVVSKWTTAGNGDGSSEMPF